MKNIIKRILSYNSVSLIIGVLGGLFGFVPIFVDYNAEVSVRWFIFTIIISLFIILILLKIISDVAIKIKQLSNPSISVISIKENGEILLTRRNTLIERYSMLVSIYYIKNDLEILLGTGYVSMIQDNFVQVRLYELDQLFEQKYEEIVTALRNEKSWLAKNIIIRNIMIYKN